MLRSLWFRLTGTVVALVIFTLGLALIATLVIAGRQLSDFIENTSDEIIRITAPADLVTDQSPAESQSGPSDVQMNEDTFGGFGINDGSGAGIEISPDGTVEINPGDRRLRQIDVQIPEIVRSQSTQLARDVLYTILIAASVSGFLAMLAGTANRAWLAPC